MENVESLTDSVVQWRLAPPSFGKVNLTAEDEAAVEKWAARKKKTEKLHIAYNKIAKKDRLWAAVQEHMEKIQSFDEETMDALPDRLKHSI